MITPIDVLHPIRIMFEHLLQRMPEIERTGPVESLRSHFIDGVKHMPVRFTPVSA